MTWNIRSLRDDRAAVVSALRRFAPDVLFLQEVPRFVRVRSRLAALARESGLVVASGGSPAPGVAIMTGLRVDAGAPIQAQLSRTPRLHRRGVALVELSLGPLTFRAASVHLGLDPAERLRHAAEIKDHLAAGHELAVVGGDLNEGSDGAAWSLLGKGLCDPGTDADIPTFPSRSPRRRIDAVMVPATWRSHHVSPSEIIDNATLIRATDHRPVIVDVMD